MNIDRLMKYWPIITALVTGLVVIVSSSAVTVYKVDEFGKKLDIALQTLQEKTTQIISLDKRVTVLEVTR